jgi:hypothetical protein
MSERKQLCVAIAAAAALASSGTWAAGAADDWATTTVRSWKLAAVECNSTPHFKGPACTRLHSIDDKLTAHDCIVTMAIWWCPISLGKTCNRFGEKGEPLNCRQILPGKRYDDEARDPPCDGPGSPRDNRGQCEDDQ